MLINYHEQLSSPVAPRLVIYSQDGYGLGHMRRTSTIAAQLLASHPEACALTLSDSPLGQFFPMAANQDYLKLPSIVKSGPGEWRASRLPVAFQVVREMRQELIHNATLRFRPDIFFVDHMPHGAMGELLPTLRALKATCPETKIVLGLRDILDAPTVVEERWRSEQAYAALEEFYDLVLIYGMQEVFDVASQYGFSQSASSRFRYCGYVCPPESTRKQQSLPFTTQSSSQLHRRPEKKLIVAMAGGGADAYPMMAAMLESAPFVHAEYPCQFVLITGPFMPEEMRNNLQRRAADLPVQIIPFVEDTYSYIQTADLIVAMAGYNTSVEVLQSGRPAILIPRRGPSAEQRMRAHLFAAHNWLTMLDPDNVTTGSLAALIKLHLSSSVKPPPSFMPNLDGLNQSTRYLLSLASAPMAHNGTLTKAVRAL